MAWDKKLYRHSPIWLQNIATSLLGWRKLRVRFGGEYQGFRDEFEQSQRLSAVELDAYQAEKLQQLIRHCYENVPFYRELMRVSNLAPEDIRKPSDLPKLPTLLKETVRRDSGKFHAQNLLTAPVDITATSGTTGTPLQIRVDLASRRRNYACFDRFKSWAGVEPTDRHAIFGGWTLVPPEQDNPPFWRSHYFAHALLFSSYHLSERNLPAYLERIREWAPIYAESYPSTIALLAQFALDENFSGLKMNAVFTSSESLLDDQRRAIERAFATSVFDQYGAAEQTVFIAQCEKGSYHINSDYGIVELLPSDTEGESRVVTTSFTNMAMPLVRYEMGDHVVPRSGNCACGRAFPMVERVLGRADDCLLTRDGRKVGRLSPVYKGIKTIRGAQIVQETYTDITLRVLPGPDFKIGDLDKLKEQIEWRLGSGIQYKVELVEDGRLNREGKFRNVICKVKATH
jgi:phenylacetate-CoA ligase